MFNHDELSPAGPTGTLHPGQNQVEVVDAVTVEEVITRGDSDPLTTVFVPVDVGFVTQDAGAFLADIGHGEEEGGC